MGDNKLVRPLTYVTGLVNQELLLQNQYLAAENRILRAQIVEFSPGIPCHRVTLAGSPRRRTRRRYLATVRSETSNPSFGRAPIRVLFRQPPNQNTNLVSNLRPATGQDGTANASTTESPPYASRRWSPASR
jgi:hypothetical protein